MNRIDSSEPRISNPENLLKNKLVLLGRDLTAYDLAFRKLGMRVTGSYFLPSVPLSQRVKETKADVLFYSVLDEAGLERVKELLRSWDKSGVKGKGVVVSYRESMNSDLVQPLIDKAGVGLFAEDNYGASVNEALKKAILTALGKDKA